jgi:hypothetical protein
MLASSVARKPATFALWPRESAVQTHSAFCDDERNSSCNPFVERLVQTGAFFRQDSGTDFDSGVSQNFDSLTTMSRIRICRTDNDHSHARADYFVGARPSPSDRRTWFHRYVQNTVFRHATLPPSQTLDFCVGQSGLTMVTARGDSVA